MNIQKRYRNWFVTTAAAVLLVMGVAKVWSSFGHAKMMAVPDPLLGVSFGNLMLLVGAAELVVAVLCFCAKVDLRLKISLVAWLATNFLVYRIGLWAVGWHHPCGCKGGLAGALHLSDQAADSMMKVILAYLLIGSYAILFSQWRQRRAEGTGGAPRQAKEAALVT